jgi:hypothetical protein
VSFDAIRWALDQPVSHASTKFLLVAMADCVNAEGAETVCWPSYAHLAKRTGMNTKTVEAGISRLKLEGFIVDTGRRAGDTGKVVVYRLNTTESGCIQPGPQETHASGTRPQTPPNPGALTHPAIPPNLESNPPKLGGQSPQKVEEIPPKTGAVSSNGTRKRTRKEPGSDGTAVAVTSIAGVPSNLFAEWQAVRNDKRAKTLTQTAVDGLLREAGKAGLTPEAAVRLCIERNWVSLNAGWGGVRAVSGVGSAGDWTGGSI